MSQRLINRRRFAWLLFLQCTLYLSAASLRGADPVFSSPRQAKSDFRFTLPKDPYNYADQKYPKHVLALAAEFDNQRSTNPITNHGATLGRVLFYDKRLSSNSTIACGSCHQQRFAFTDPNSVSRGFNGESGSRNSMSLVNLRYHRSGRFFWDERADSLEAQVLMPIIDPLEMGHTLPSVVGSLCKDEMYSRLFELAFGDSEITQERIAKALAQFVRSMTSFDSRYDQGLSKVGDPLADFPNYSEEENLGKAQFFGRGRCAECHLPPISLGGKLVAQFAFFQLTDPVVNGLDADEENVDAGVGQVTRKMQDLGKFRASSLRNIELTAPYMHDGRFRTLDQVIEHYNWSVKPHQNLDTRLQDFSANGMALPEVEKVALAAFLKTLTDDRFIRDPKYSDPFLNAAQH